MHAAAHNIAPSKCDTSFSHEARRHRRISGVIGKRERDCPGESLRKPFMKYSSCGIALIPHTQGYLSVPDGRQVTFYRAKPSLKRNATKYDNTCSDVG